MSDTYTLKETFEKRFDEMDDKITNNHNGVFEYLRRIEKKQDELGIEVESLKMTRVQMWTAIAIILLLGGTILTLSVMAVNSKIREGTKTAVDQAFTDRFDKIEIVK